MIWMCMSIWNTCSQKCPIIIIWKIHPSLTSFCHGQRNCQNSVGWSEIEKSASNNDVGIIAVSLLFCTTPFFEALTTELPECGRNKGIDRECTTAAAVVRVLGGKFLEVHIERFDIWLVEQVCKIYKKYRINKRKTSKMCNWTVDSCWFCSSNRLQCWIWFIYGKVDENLWRKAIETVKCQPVVL